MHSPVGRHCCSLQDLTHYSVKASDIAHPQFVLLIPSDFNHASLSSTLPTFTQYVKCHTRDNRTLDLLYVNTKDAYTSSPLPPLGCSDHSMVYLSPAYIPMVNKQPPTKRYVRSLSEETSMALRDCFDTTDWDVL